MYLKFYSEKKLQNLMTQYSQKILFVLSIIKHQAFEKLNVGA